MITRLCLVAAAMCAASTPVMAERILVSDQTEFAAASAGAEAGDTIVLASGEWHDFELVISGRGRADAPITVTPEVPGKTVLTGQSSLRIGGEFVTVSGLVFRDGYSPRGEVVSFRVSKEDQASNSRITQVVIDGFSKPDRYESDYWVGIYGQNNRFDHNHLSGKTNKGVTLAVRLDTEESRENGHRIERNYFGPRAVLGSNGGETLRIGTSRYSAYNSNTLVAENVFDRTGGEVEIISSKSGGNIFRGNLFLKARGTLTLRHGDNNVVEGNVFLGGGADYTGGIRVINRGQKVHNNYMEGLRGEAFSSALAIMNGVPNSPVNRYVEVAGARIENNTVVDSRRIAFNVGADEERSAAPSDTAFTNNLMSGLEGESFLEVYGDVSGIEFSGNRAGQGGVSRALGEISQGAIAMERGENGLLYPTAPELADIGAPRDLRVLSLEEVGVNWYTKPGGEAAFGSSGRVIAVEPGQGTLAEAVMAAGPGDVLSLAAGEYVADRSMPVSEALSVVGAGADATTIVFTRPSLFDLREGGSLRLESLAIDGERAPDSVGNSVIRTAIFPIQSNLRVELDEVAVRNLAVNKSFNVITLGKSTMADHVSVTKSLFADITGTIVSAAAETDDYGQYNVEYLAITDSEFANIGEPLANIYRGGRDESTFGPNVTITGNALSNVGLAATNRAGGSVRLHGVQIADLSRNAVKSSAPFRVVHTVGTPSTVIAGNVFHDTENLVLEELNFDGAHRAKLTGNVFAEGGSQ